MRSRLAIAVVLAATCATAARPALAGDDHGEVEARRLAARAQVHYDLGEYGLAIIDYREAYRVHPSPGLLFNLAQAYRRSGDCVSATEMYQSYLRQVPRSPYRRVVRQHVSSLAECNRRNTGWVLLEGAEPKPGRDRKILGLAVGGGGAAVALAGAYFSTRSASIADEVARKAQDEDVPPEQVDELDARGKRLGVVGATFLVAGGAAVAAGATLYALGWREGRRATSFSVAPATKGAAVSVSWSF